MEMDSRTKWQDDMRAASTIIAVLVLVSVLAAVCVGLLLGN
jgi:FlaG/FlaF family flagellin (archaellin)